MVFIEDLAMSSSDSDSDSECYVDNMMCIEDLLMSRDII